MTLAFWFWVIYVIAFLFSGYRQRWAFVETSLVWWVLIGILGYAQFHGPLK